MSKPTQEYVTREEFEKFKTEITSVTTSVPAVYESNVKKEKTPRAPTEYNLFVQSESKKIRELNPGIKAPEVMKKCGEAWNILKTQAK